MKKIYSIIAVLLVALFAHSCYVDKGNYDYNPIDEIEISGIAESYSVMSLSDVLEIKPEITYPSQGSLEYLWVVARQSDGWNYDMEKERDTISQEKNLSYLVTKGPGIYKLFYYVKNSETGYYRVVQSDIEVGTLFSKGHYILKETASGDSDLDLIANSGEFVTDIFSNKFGAPLNGKPRSMGIWYDKVFIDPDDNSKTFAHTLGVVTYGDVVNVYRASDMTLIFDKESLFYQTHDGPVFKMLTAMWSSDLFTIKGNYYTYALGNAGESGKYGFSEGISGGSDMIAYSNKSATTLFWDDIGKRLVRTNYNATPFLVTSDVYPTTDLNYDCLTLVNTNQNFAVLFKDLSVANSYKLYNITVGGLGSTPSVANVKTLDESYGITQATLFAGNEKSGQLIYFVKDNEVFYYDLVTNNEHSLTIPNLPAGEEITYISNRHFNLSSPAFDYFVIATHKAGQYKLQMYNMVGGIPVEAPVVEATGSGKVKEVHFLNNSFSYNNLMMGDDYSR